MTIEKINGRYLLIFNEIAIYFDKYKIEYDGAVYLYMDDKLTVMLVNEEECKKFKMKIKSKNLECEVQNAK